LWEKNGRVEGRGKGGEREKKISSLLHFAWLTFFSIFVSQLGHDKKSKRERPCVRTQRREKGRGAQGRPTE
jgi:hypothetical protein